MKTPHSEETKKKLYDIFGLTENWKKGTYHYILEGVEIQPEDLVEVENLIEEVRKESFLQGIEAAKNALPEKMDNGVLDSRVILGHNTCLDMSLSNLEALTREE